MHTLYFEHIMTFKLSLTMFREIESDTLKSTVLCHRQFRVTFRETYLFFPNDIVVRYFDYPVIIILISSRDHETLDCTAFRESESTRKCLHVSAKTSI